MRHRDDRRMPSWLVGLLTLVVIGLGSLYAFSSLLNIDLRPPWSESYQVKAVFSSAQAVRETAPVRIAGVQVGEVKSVEPLLSDDPAVTAQATDDPSTVTENSAPGQQAAIITMELTEDARPMRSDAEFKIRPRLFLEGNYFIDVQPGSPGADEVENEHTFPVNQTSNSVQLDQVLTALQSDVRTNLQVLLNQFGNALVKHGGAEGFRELYRTSPAANKFTSQVNEAFLGTEPGDLGQVIKGLDRVVRGLGRNEAALKSLITNFRVFTGSFAAEDVALGRAIEELPGVLDAAEPAFANLNAAFPPLRAFAREALPGTETADETLTAAIPFIDQVRALVSERELRGLVGDLRPTIPELAQLVRANITFLEETRALSSCFNEVVIPWSHDTVNPVDPLGIYPHDPAGRVFEETAYGLEGIAGESRSGDANGQYIRIGGTGGVNTFELPFPSVFGPNALNLGATPVGAMPRLTDSEKTRFRPDVACETQEPPNLAGGLAGIQASPLNASAPASLPDGTTSQDLREAERSLGIPRDSLGEIDSLEDQG